MNIALVISCMRSGGAERVMAQLASCWAERGDEVTLITLDALENDCYPLDPRVRRVALHLLGESESLLAGIANSFRRISAIRRAVRASGAQVVLAFEDRTNVLALAATAFTGLRRVVSERNNPGKNEIGTIWNALRRMAYPFADCVVVQTAALLPWAREATFGRREVAVIANPLRDMRPYARESQAGADRTIVAVGRLAPQKGFDVLLAAFAAVSPHAPDWKLIVVGRGEERDRLAQLAADLRVAERVSFPGWVPEPGEVLASAGIFVMSSHYEGFPNALLEAMACGVPVISTRWAGLQDIVTHEVDGLTVPLANAPELAAAMRRLMLDQALRERLGRNALAVAERYRLSAVVREWDAVLTASSTERVAQAPAPAARLRRSHPAAGEAPALRKGNRTAR